MRELGAFQRKAGRYDTHLTAENILDINGMRLFFRKSPNPPPSTDVLRAVSMDHHTGDKTSFYKKPSSWALSMTRLSREALQQTASHSRTQGSQVPQAKRGHPFF